MIPVASVCHFMRRDESSQQLNYEIRGVHDGLNYTKLFVPKQPQNSAMGIKLGLNSRVCSAVRPSGVELFPNFSSKQTLSKQLAIK